MESEFRPVLDPVGQSAGLSALAAATPLLLLFVLLGAVRMKAHRAALAALACALVVAAAGFGMPVLTAANSALAGAAFGLFPIMWIVVNAIWIYNMTVQTGHFEVLRRSICSVSPDLRVQAVVIAFCFGGLLEALAGFGTPVAISAAMLIALGLAPMKAAAAALVANTAPVAFGAMAAPITTLAALTDLSVHEVSSMVGRQTPVLAAVVPLVLVLIVDGRRGLRQTWPAALLVGVVFALAQFAAANYLSAQLTDVVAALAATGALVLMLRRWRPAEEVAAESAAGERAAARAEGAARLAHRVEAGADGGGPALRTTPPNGAAAPRPSAPTPLPGDHRGLLAGPDRPGQGAAGADHHRLPLARAARAERRRDPREVHRLHPRLAGLQRNPAAPVRHRRRRHHRPAPGESLRVYWHTLCRLRTAALTVALVLGLAYLLNLSGQTTAIGHWLAGAGAAFAFLSPVLGWLGVAVTGSDTSANALFGSMQATVAAQTGADPLLYASANSSGGVIGKMISPQNLAIATAVTGIDGREGDLLRKVIGWSLLFLLAMCLLVVLQAGDVLGWMVP
ncbi:L-lactate permease [Nocardiopsis composta]